MTSRRSLLGWLTGGRGRKRKPSADTPYVLDRPVDRNVSYNAVSTFTAKYQIGQVVRHRHFPFRGIIFDVDPQFANTDEWYEAIPGRSAASKGPTPFTTSSQRMSAPTTSPMCPNRTSCRMIRHNRSVIPTSRNGSM
jgi:hypothetical protein